MDKRYKIPSDWLKITGWFLIWRVVLFLIGALAGRFLSYQPSFPYAESIFVPYHLPQWLYSWANFDGVHYLTIIEKGYTTINYIQAFFPLYPISVRILNVGISNALLAGLMISNVAALVVWILWYESVRSRFSAKIAWISLAIFSLFPTALFMGAFYTESLFLLLILSCLIFMDRRQWLLAGVVAALASATRVVGIFLVPVLLIEWLDQQGYLSELVHRPTKISVKLPAVVAALKQNWRVPAAMILGCLGLAAYMGYLAVTFHDPLYFVHVQSAFGAGRQDSLVLYPQVVWRYLKILITSPFDLKYFAYVQEFAVGLGGAVLLVVGAIQAWKSQAKWSNWFFALCAFILPTTTGTFSSMGRYVLVCLVFWPMLAQSLSKHRYLMVGYLLISSLLLVINTILFIQGYWVA